jgi:protein gp37
VIVGGESGPQSRAFDVAWARSIVRQCQTAGVPVFVKQLGANAIGTDSLRDKKGGDPNEWAIDLRVREFPRIGLENQ